ncbi:MAG: hypothetical protein IT324_31165 [Anaerolineae bacterium]|nr:hypothetical protein [Anaerolineae bacterium]
MSRAQIRFDVNQSIRINQTLYRVAEHPALPGIPYAQRGARGFVIQLIAPGGERMALKYFKLKYRVPELVNVTEALKQYADLPGLRAARRTVFTKATHAELLTRYPALEYGVLMPWLPGVTWYDLVTTKAPLTPPDSLKIAQATSAILAGFEERRLAHCDVAGANVMVNRKAAQIELVDIEEMYGPQLPQPVELPAGQDGYQHRTSRTQGQWNADGDRFGAAVLLAEMLGWADPRIRQNSADEHYFAAAEVQDQDSPRYRLLYEVLRDQYAPTVAEPFEQAWRSVTLADCPPIKQWHDSLAALLPPAALASAQPFADSSPVVIGRRSLDGVPVISMPQAPKPPGPERLQLDGIKLCRNCGAQNPSNENFCKRCGFYIGTGARRQPLLTASAVSTPRQPIAPQPAPAPPTAPVSGTAPQVVPLQRNTDEIIAARRVSSGGNQPMQRIEITRPRTPETESNAGTWIVLAIILAVVISILALALIAK